MDLNSGGALLRMSSQVDETSAGAAADAHRVEGAPRTRLASHDTAHRRAKDERRERSIFANHRFHTAAHVPSPGVAIPGQLRGAALHVLAAVSGNAVRPADVSPELPRHRPAEDHQDPWLPLSPGDAHDGPQALPERRETMASTTRLQAPRGRHTRRQVCRWNP